MTFPRTPFSTHLSGSAQETELRIRSIFQWSKKRPPFFLLALVVLITLSCGSLVSCYPVQPILEPESISDSSSLSNSPSNSNLGNDQIIEQSLTGLTLDEFGKEDDSLHVRSDPFKARQLTLTVQLGSGKTLEKTWSAGNWLPNVFTAPLIVPDRDAIVLDCSVFGSTYGGTVVLVTEVSDGQLVERYASDLDSDATFQQGCTALVNDPGSTASLRVPCLVDKWHASEYYTLTWDGQTFQAIGDGYFVDRDTIPVSDQRELTLALRGIRESTSYTKGLVYTEAQILEGSSLIQTITPTPYLPQEYYEYSGFLADSSVEIKDINFDGASDFGLLCDNTVNKVHAWFVWDKSQQQFRYLAHLGGNLELKSQEKKLVVQLYDESTNLSYPQVYAYDAAGQLIPVKGQIPDSELAAIFQPVLKGSQSFYETESQQTLDINRIGRAMTPDDVPFRTTSFAITDLDRDNRFELVLEVTAQDTPGIGGFVILREQMGFVYGYTIWYRAFNDLKADGTFSFSNSAFSSGFGRLSFQEDGYTIHQIAYSDIYSHQPEQLVYYLDGSSVAESAFDAAILQQSRKPNAVWHPFTDDNINNLAALAENRGFPQN